MINRKYLKLIRSKHTKTLNNFIYDKLAERIIDSIDLLKIEFNQILEIGYNDNAISDYIQNKFKKNYIDSADIFLPKNNISNVESLPIFVRIALSLVSCTIFHPFLMKDR